MNTTTARQQQSAVSIRTRRAAQPPRRRTRTPIATTLSLLLVLLSSLPGVSHALPSFARQTGMPCSACHTTYPQLTQFGREFKMQNYTLASGQSTLPPLAVMLQPSFTHTAEKQPGGAAQDFNSNDNAALTQASVFWAGRLFDPFIESITGPVSDTLKKIGVFAQVSYDGIEKSWAWDNVELRYGDRTTVDGRNVQYGFYLNNSPTLGDPWNTTPAWSFPYTGSGLAPTPAAGTLLGGGLAQQVIGAGGWARLDNGVYAGLGVYRNLSATSQDRLGVDPSGETELADPAPYWRLAREVSSGHSRLEIGTYGMAANTWPGRDSSAGKDHIVDVALDSQYQYSGGANEVTVMANWIHEHQALDASRSLGLAAGHNAELSTTALTASWFRNATWGTTAQLFSVSGTDDPLLYADSRTGSPDSSGVILQLDWLPFAQGGPGFWPHSGVKFSVQGTHYFAFDGASHNVDGAGRSARDNDTLYLEAWIAI